MLLDLHKYTSKSHIKARDYAAFQKASRIPYVNASVRIANVELVPLSGVGESCVYDPSVLGSSVGGSVAGGLVAG
jgi:hypothetical protein